MTSHRPISTLGGACLGAPVLLLVLVLAGCGSAPRPGGGSTAPVRTGASAPPFPSVAGKNIAQLTRGLGPGPIVAPTVRQLDPGRDRFGFGLFSVAQKQVSGVPVALYLERQGTSTVTGPYAATEQSLAVPPQFDSDTVKSDPAAAKTFYSAQLRFPKPGVYAVVALARIGGRLVASSPIGARVLAKDTVPNVGQKAPLISTPTVKSVHGNVASIDTRRPPDSMHDVNYADAYGKRPIVLLFATPALCQSRTCAPVTDVTEAVKAAHAGGPIAFIHNEIYKDNTIKPGCLEGTRPPTECYRPQLLAFNLETEPFLFVIDKHGRIAARLEGAFSRDELEAALKPVLK
jgi:hypothetical protein